MSRYPGYAVTHVASRRKEARSQGGDVGWVYTPWPDRGALARGGARGLGAGMAEALARAGAAVAIGDIREDLGKATADTLSAAGATAAFVTLDVTDDASWERAISATIGELGGLDIVVNNAGVEISGLVIDFDPADVRRML